MNAILYDLTTIAEAYNYMPNKDPVQLHTKLIRPKFYFKNYI